MDGFAGEGAWKEEKEMVAALVRKHTALANRRVAARLGMGHEVSVTRAGGASLRIRAAPLVFLGKRYAGGEALQGGPESSPQAQST